MSGAAPAAAAQYQDLIARVPQPDLETPFYKAWKKEQAAKQAGSVKNAKPQPTMNEMSIDEILRVLSGKQD
jgi:hypothetical protein